MTTSTQYVSVTQPVGQAIEHVKRMLFRPFDFSKWMTIGVCAWLAGLGERGFSSSANYNNGQHKGTMSAHQALEQAKAWLAQNFYWLGPLVVTVVVLGLALWLVMLWLNSRGKFMFLHCVALDRAEVSEPWRKYAGEAWSLFWFRVVLWLCQMACLVPVLVWAGLVGFRMVERETVSGGDIAALVIAGLGIVLLGCIFAIVGKFTRDFVVPIQYLRGGGTVAAWRELLRLIGGYTGEFILYVLFSILLAICIAVLTMAVVLATCCIACCLLAIPFLGTVLLLPVLIFQRAYSAYYLAQFGTDYDVFAAGVRPKAA